MGVLRSSLLADKLTGTAALGARPTTNQHGIDISSWKSGSFLPRQALAFIDGAAAAALSPIDAFPVGVELWGYVTALAKWEYVGQLTQNGGNVNIIDATHGAVVELDDLAPFDRLALAATVAGGACTYRFAPMESWQ